MQLTDWVALWWSGGGRDRRGRRRAKSHQRASRAAGAELLESRVLPAVVDLISLADNVGNGIVNGAVAANPENLVAVDGTVYFQAHDGSHGRELWKSDGTPAGTVLVKDIQPGAANGMISGSRSAVAVGSQLFFVANDGAHGFELWKSNGTAGGTGLVADLFVGVGSSLPRQLTNVGGTLFFTADDGVHGRELWKSDGTAAGTVMVKDISLTGGAAPLELVNLGGVLFFTANTGTTGRELWRSDGTSAGTVLVKDIRTGRFSASPQTLTIVNQRLYFSASDGVTGRELWKSDGTAAGTVLVKDIRAGTGDSAPRQLVNANGTLYFSANDVTNGRELWKSNGTSAGTVLVKNINAGRADSNPTELTLVGSALFFSAASRSEGRELWTSNGSAAGTRLVKNIFAGAAHSNPQDLVNLDGQLGFTAQEAAHGRELWISDGSAANTTCVRDLYDGRGSAGPSDLTAVGPNGWWMFSADGGAGRKLWRLTTAENPTQSALPTVSLSAESTSLAEGDSGHTSFVYTVTRRGDTRAPSTIDYAVTGLGANPADASDFGETLPSGTIAFAAGETTKTITINVSGDTVVESDEGFAITLSNPSGATLGTATATGTITNDDTSLSITATSATKAEGNSGNTPFTFTITRSGNTNGTSSVNYAVTGSDTNATDFGGTLPSGTINFAAGETSKTLTINVSGDTVAEADEGFSVTLSNAVGANLATATATGTIRNEDVPSLTIVANTASQYEGNSGSTPFTFTVSRTGPASGTASVNYAVSGSGTNKAEPTDFGGTLPNGTISFAAGETSKTITIPVSGDTLVESDEGFSITLSNPSGASLGTATATGTITNDDATLSITATDANKPDGSGDIYTPFTFTLSRTGNTDGPATAAWTVAGITYSAAGSGTNSANEFDFGGIFPKGTVSFAAGETTKTITVNVLGEGAVENDESFKVTLSNPTGVSIKTAVAIGTIVADESEYAIYHNQAVLSMAEGNDGTTPFTINLTRIGQISEMATVEFAVAPVGYQSVDAADFGGTMPSGTLTFPIGATTRTLTINIVGDTKMESDEQFRVTLSNGTGWKFPSVTFFTRFTILNDDTSLRVSGQTPILAEGNDETRAATFTVYRGGVTSGISTVNYAVTGSGLYPADANDFGGILPTGQITFAPRETAQQITVNVSGDTLAEFDETFAVILSNPTGATMEPVEATVTMRILDDETRAGSPWVVDTLTDEVDGDVTAGHFSLREAIERANLIAGSHTITFDPSLTANGPTTVTLTQGGMYLGSEVEIIGPTDQGLTISGNHQSSIFDIWGTATISNLTFADGQIQSPPYSGGAIFNGGQTTLVDCTFVGNEAAAGGAIFNSGDLTIIGSTLSGNRANSGGAIFNSPNATLRLKQSTITGNVSNSGGGIFNGSQFVEKHRHYPYNPGWYSYYIWEFGSASASNCIIAGNTAQQDSRHSDLGGATDYISTTNSLIGDQQTSLDFDIATVLDPVLADNGGLTKTHALVAGSPAINAGAVASVPADTIDLDGDGDRTEPMPFDQRGAGFARVIDGLPDIGAFEFGTPWPTVNVAVSPASVSEDGSRNLLFTITRDVTSGPLTVNFGVSGSATEGIDFSAVAERSVTLADGIGSVTIAVDPTADNGVESDENIVVTLLRGNGYRIGTTSATGVILNDDLVPDPALDSETPTLSVVAVNSTRREGTSSSQEPFLFRAIRFGDSSGAATVNYAITGLGETPADADDFGGTWPTGTIHFANSETSQLIEIGVASDSLLEPDETFLLTLSDATGANLGMPTAAGLILNDDSTLAITATNASRTEGQDSEFTVTRDGDLSSTATVQFRVTGSGEHPASIDDFIDRPRGTITFAPGESSKTFTLRIVSDTTVEPDEDFTVTLTNPNGSTITTATVTSTIINDDSNLSIIPLDANKYEGNSGTTPFTFKVIRTGLTDRTATVTYSLKPRGYNDYFAVSDSDFDFSRNPRSGTITFAPGDSEKTITLDVVGNTAYPYGGDRPFTVTLSNVTGATLGTASANGMILNDDNLVVVALPDSITEGNAGTTPFTIHFHRDGLVTEPASFDYSVSSYYTQSADATDFGGTMPSGTVQFAPGETMKSITLNVSADLESEEDEYFQVNFSNPTGTIVGKQKGKSRKGSGRSGLFFKMFGAGLLTPPRARP